MCPSGLSGSVLSWRGGIQECAGLRPSWGWSCDQLPLPVKPKAGRSSAHLARCSPKAGGMLHVAGFGLILPTPHLTEKETEAGRR